MNNTDLNNIGDIIVSEPIAFSFNTPGWIILAGLLLVLAILFSIRKYKIYRKNKYRRDAANHLLHVLESVNDNNTRIYQFVLMLKKVAIISFGKQSVGSLYGKEWVEFLRKKLQKPQLWLDSEHVFTSYLYQQERQQWENEKLNSFYNDSINWIKNHHV